MEPLYKLMLLTFNKNNKPRKVHSEDIYYMSTLINYFEEFSIDPSNFNNSLLTQSLKGKLIKTQIPVEIKLLNWKKCDEMNWR